MARELTPTRATVGIDPSVPGRSRVIRNPGVNDVPDQLARLSQILDPYGQGAAAQYFRREREKVLEEVTAAFQRDASVDEAAIFQTNPGLRGAGYLVKRRLDELRGERSANRAIDLARIEFARIGMEGAPPEAVEEFYDGIQAEVLQRGELGHDGQQSFLAGFAEHRRKVEQDALDKHIGRNNEMHIEAVGETARAEVARRAESDDWEGYGDVFLESALAEEGLAGPASHDGIIQAHVSALNESVERDPNTGSAGYHAILDAQVPAFDADGNAILNPDGSLKMVNYVANPKHREAIAALADEADNARQRASEGTAKQHEAEVKGAVEALKAGIAEDVLAGLSPTQIVARSKERMADPRVPAEAKFDGLEATRKVEKQSDTMTAMDNDEYSRFKRDILLSNKNFDHILDAEMSNAQRKELTELWSGVVKSPPIDSKIDEDVATIRRMRVGVGLSGEVDAPRNQAVDDAATEFRVNMTEILIKNPELLEPTRAAELKALSGKIRKEFQERIEREHPSVMIDLGDVSGKAVPREQSRPQHQFNVGKIIADHHLNTGKVHEQAVKTNLVHEAPFAEGQATMLPAKPINDPSVKAVMDAFDAAMQEADMSVELAPSPAPSEKQP